jgi:uncharacterized protein (TIGR02231 family)
MLSLKSFAALALGLCLSHNAFAISVPTAADQVTVYPAGARVVRLGKAELPSGVQTVLFAGLPASLREDSLRLRVEGPKGTTVYGLKLREAFSEQQQPKQTEALAEKIQALQDERTDLADRIATNKSEADILRVLADKGAAKASNESGAKVAELAGAVHTVGLRLGALAAEARKLERAQRDLDKKLAALQAEQSQGGGGGTSTRVAEAEMELAQGGACSFEIEYFVDQASWSPRYDLRLRASDKEPKVELDFLAQVQQTSGEDWNDVQLSLSTARPSSDSQVPDPTQWWLDYENQRPAVNSNLMFMSAKKSSVTRSEVPSASFLGLPQDKSYAAADAVAQVEDLGPATLFNVKRRTKIPSVGQGQRVTIAKSEHPVDLHLVVVPRLSPAGFLEAKIHYGGETPLLPGPAQLFRDSDLAGQVMLPSTVPGESFDLGFGMDERVKATRKRRAQKTGSAGFLGMQGKRAYDWDIKISNFHEGEREIEVREQLPKSRQDGIKVSSLELDPKPLEEDPQKPGLLTWNLKLKKGEEKALHLRYEVKWPEDQRVTGLE